MDFTNSLSNATFLAVQLNQLLLLYCLLFAATPDFISRTIKCMFKRTVAQIT